MAMFIRNLKYIYRPSCTCFTPVWKQIYLQSTGKLHYVEQLYFDSWLFRIRPLTTLTEFAHGLLLIYKLNTTFWSILEHLSLNSIRYKTDTATKTNLLKKSVRTTKKTKKDPENASQSKTSSTEKTVPKSRKKTAEKEKTANDTKKTAKSKSKNVIKTETSTKKKALTSTANNNNVVNGLSINNNKYVDSNDGVEEIINDSNGEVTTAVEEYIESKDRSNNDSDKEFAVGRVGMKYREGTIGARLYEVSTLAEINGYLSLGQVSWKYFIIYQS